MFDQIKAEYRTRVEPFIVIPAAGHGLIPTYEAFFCVTFKRSQLATLPDSSKSSAGKRHPLKSYGSSDQVRALLEKERESLSCFPSNVRELFRPSGRVAAAVSRA